MLGKALRTSRYRDVAEAKLYHGEAISVLRRCGRTKRLALATRKQAGDLKAAQALVEEARVLCKALGDDRMHNSCTVQHASITFSAGQTAEAIDLARRAVEASRQHGILTNKFAALNFLANFLILDDQVVVRPRCGTQTLRAFVRPHVDLPGSINRLALVLAAQRKADTAAHLAGFAGGYADRHQLSRYEINIAIRSRLVERPNCAMGPDECQTAIAAGAHWSEQEAIATAEAA